MRTLLSWASPFDRHVALLSVLLLVPEAILTCADLGIIFSPVMRWMFISYGALWEGLWRGWLPNYMLQPWAMLVTYSFLHAGPAHLIGNLVTIWLFGVQLRMHWGGSIFWTVYMISVLSGALVHLVLSDSYRPVIGASAGAYGLVTAWIFLEAPKLGSYRAMRSWQVASLLALVTINGISTLLISGGLAWEAHFGGMFGGGVAAVSITFYIWRKRRSNLE